MHPAALVLVGCLAVALAPRSGEGGETLGTAAASSERPWREVPAPLTEAELRELEFDPELVQKLARRIGSRAALLHGRSGPRHPPIGLVWSVESVGADTIVTEARKELAEKGYVIFVAERSFGTEPDRIGLVRAADPLAPVLLQGTAGPNMEVSNQDVLSRLREWAKRAPFDLVGAGPDWIELEFRAVPAKLDTLVEEIRELAPDSLSRDADGLERVRVEIRRSRRVFLWWE